mmetsp:Transcript_1679/g.5846  ORF Transcript_1679/g.5846 Transcript_1679/m.5846 type:complete len:203 (+) Transcript_1679:107-715(+)
MAAAGCGARAASGRHRTGPQRSGASTTPRRGPARPPRPRGAPVAGRQRRCSAPWRACARSCGSASPRWRRAWSSPWSAPWRPCWWAAWARCTSLPSGLAQPSLRSSPSSAALWPSSPRPPWRAPPSGAGAWPCSARWAPSSSSPSPRGRCSPSRCSPSPPPTPSSRTWTRASPAPSSSTSRAAPWARPASWCPTPRRAASSG